MRLHLRLAAVTAALATASALAAAATAQPEADSALRKGEMSVPFEGKIGKGPVAQRAEFDMRVVHKLVSRGFSLKPGTPKRVSEISAQQVPVTCGEGEDAFQSATSFELPKAYKLRGRKPDVAAKFKAVRSYRHISGQQLRVVMRGKLTKRGKRAKGTLRIVSKSTSGGSTCRATTRWSGRQASS
ncbi:MAG: hypothetical protein GXY03_12490 [Solirubrobacterales bacterium]|nr:hypothetical protein [Solirubrobacterales bacterium]